MRVTSMKMSVSARTKTETIPPVHIMRGLDGLDHAMSCCLPICTEASVGKQPE